MLAFCVFIYCPLKLGCISSAPGAAADSKHAKTTWRTVMLSEDLYSVPCTECTLHYDS